MRTVRASLVYFASVFGIGFVLGTLRVLLLVPQLGARLAELVELPLMVLASYACARWIVRRFAPLSVAQRLGVGATALALLVVAELGVVVAIQGQGVAQYVAGRDPVSGTAYLAALLAFAVMPLLVEPGHRDPGAY